MYLECPKCLTVFRASDSILQQAGGKVRCGVCDEVFDGTTHTRTDLPTSDEKSSRSQDKTSSVQLDEEEDNLSATKNKNQSGEDDLDEFTSSYDEDEFGENPKKNKQGKGFSEEAEATREEDDEDFFIEEGGPEEDEAEPPFRWDEVESADPVSRLKRIAWIVGVAIMAIVMMGQTLYFFHAPLASLSFMQPIVTHLCGWLVCRDHEEETLAQDTEKIILDNKSVRSHPTLENALLVEATLHNEADFAQRYPVIQLHFIDAEGRVIAARRFKPSEYGITEAEEEGVPPKGEFNMTLNVRDPGTTAKEFFIDFP